MKNLSLKSIRSKKEKNERLNAFIDSVKKEMLLNNIYYKNARFSCFDDNIFTYFYANHSIYFEFNFICKDTLLDKMTIKDLLELKKITFFKSIIYDRQTLDILGSTSYSIFDCEETENNIALYNELTDGIDQNNFPDGVYISDGVYLQSDGTYKK